MIGFLTHITIRLIAKDEKLLILKIRRHTVITFNLTNISSKKKITPYFLKTGVTKLLRRF